jgi:hypothetical protein
MITFLSNPLFTPPSAQAEQSKPQPRSLAISRAIMAQIPDVGDFASFLDLDLDLAFYNTEEQHKQQQHHNEQMQDAQHQLQNTQMADHMNGSDHQESVFDFSMPVDVQFGMSQQHHQQINSLIPPTPNSVEMHADTAAHYMHQLEAQRALLHQYQMKQTQVINAHDSNYFLCDNLLTDPASLIRHSLRP